MIRICTYWESVQMPHDLEWRMWRQLRGAYGIREFYFAPIVADAERLKVAQYDTIGEALEEIPGPKVILDPRGTTSIDDAYDALPTGADLTLVLGSTEHSVHQYANGDDFVVSLETPGDADLYSLNAAAIALDHWVRR